MKSKKLLCFLLTLCNLFAAGQVIPHYAGTAANPKLTFVDNIPNCVVTSTNQHPCWHYSGFNLETGGTVVTYNAVVANGTTTAISGNGNYCLKYIYGRCAGVGYIYTFSGWTSTPAWGQYQSYSYSPQPTAITKLAIDTNQQVWALAGSCGSGKQIWQSYLNGGVEWWQVPTSQCAIDLSIASDGTMLIVDPSGNVLESTNSGQTWSTLSFAGGGWRKVSVSDATLAYALNASNGYLYELSISTSAVSFMGVSGIDVSVDSSNVVYLVDGNHTVWQWTSAQGWSELRSANFTAIANGGSMNIWAFSPGPTGTYTNIWTLPDQTFTVTATITGNSTCGTNGCGNATIQPGVDAWFSVNKSPTGVPQGTSPITGTKQSATSAVNFSPTFTMYDPFVCAITACQYSEVDYTNCFASGNVCVPNPPTICVNGGTDPDNDGDTDTSESWCLPAIVWGVAALQFPVDAEVAYTRVNFTGQITNCYFDKNDVEYCDYSTGNWCTTATTPPDNDFTGAYIKDTSPSKFPVWWDTWAPCWRLAAGTPWKCFKGLGYKLYDNPAQAACSYHP